MSLIARFLRDDRGATAIEYGLIAAGISVAIIATVAGLGTKLKSTFTAVDNALWHRGAGARSRSAVAQDYMITRRCRAPIRDVT